jgi:single-strand DNA-binding protein
MNQVIISGNAGKDHELKYTQTGTAVLTFSVAVYDGKDQDGKSKSQWFRVKAFKELAERINGRISCGLPVVVFGKAQQGSYQNKEGVKVNTFDVIASMIDVYGKLEKKESHSEGTQERYTPDQKHDVYIPGEEEML